MVLVFNKKKKLAMPWHNGNGHAEMKEYQARIGLLCDIAEEASSITQVSTLLERILKVTQHTIGTAITAIFIKDESKARVHLPITISQYDDAARRQATMIESEIADLVAIDAIPLMINNVATDSRISLNSKNTSGSIVKSIIATPILKGKKVVGVLMGVNKDDGGDFTQRDFEVLKRFASTEALILLVSLEKTAIENVNSLTANPTLLEGYRNTVHQLASTIDVKDDHVYEHSRRVKDYALLAANVLSLNPRELQAIEFGALLHDIGKIGVDSEILRKPGPLTHEEWKIVYGHPQKGADILKDIPHLKDAINIVLHHHERYDGTGYPKKLKGEAIPIGARLVAVVNAFDTMTTDHSYRAALSVDEALKKLLYDTGTQFCPKAIEAFVTAYKKYRSNLPVRINPDPIQTIETKSTEKQATKFATETKDNTKDLLAKVKRDTEEIIHLKEKAEKETQAARIRAEKEDREAKIKAEKEAEETKLRAEKETREAKIMAEKQAREAKIKAEKEAREAKIRAKREAEEAKKAKIKAEKDAREAKIKAAKEAKIRAEKEAREAKESKIKAEKEAKETKIRAKKEAREAKIKAEKEAKETKKTRRAQQERKSNPAKIDAEVCQGNIRLVVPITSDNEEVKLFANDLKKIEGTRILMLSHSEGEGHLFLCSLNKPITLTRYIREIPRVENVDKKGGVIWVDLRDGSG
jgi:putative nucleotidyltransferase with HDIG domain